MNRAACSHRGLAWWVHTTDSWQSVHEVVRVVSVGEASRMNMQLRSPWNLLFADLISVVNFDSNARVICEAVLVRDAPTVLPFHGGGTDFGPAMRAAHALLGRDIGNAERESTTPVLIFMTDGHGSTLEGAALLHAIRAAHESRSMQCFIVGFGQGVHTSTLQEFANAGRGTYFAVPDIDALTGAFVDIAHTALQRAMYSSRLSCGAEATVTLK